MEPNHTLPTFPANNTTNNRTPARRAHTSKIVLGSLGIAVASVVLAVSAFRSGGKATVEQQARLDAIAASVKELTTNVSTGSIAQGNSIGSLDAKVSKSSADTIKEIDALRSDIKALANQVKKSAEDDAGKTAASQSENKPLVGPGDILIRYSDNKDAKKEFARIAEFFEKTNWGDPNGMLESTTQIEKKFRELLKTLSPIVEFHERVRINAISWGIRAAKLLTKDEFDFSHAIEIMGDFPSEHDGIPIKKLEEALDTAIQKHVSQIRSQIVESAKKRIVAYERSQSQSDARLVMASYEELSELEDKTETEKVLLKEIYEHVQRIEFNEFNQSITQRENMSKGNKTELLAVYSITLSEARARLMETSPDFPSIQSLYRDNIEKLKGKEQALQKEINEELSRQYSRWAWEKIQKFRRDFDENSNKISNMKFSSTNDQFYSAIKNSTKENLLVISASYLDPIISRFYSQAINDAFKKLDDRKELQLELAKNEIDVDKLTPKDIADARVPSPSSEQDGSVFQKFNEIGRKLQGSDRQHEERFRASDVNENKNGNQIFVPGRGMVILDK